MGTIDLIICGFYLIMTIVIGGLVGKKQHSTEEYFLAGRGMSWWPIAISLFASLFSAISYIAMPGEAYNFGCTMLVSGLVGVVALPVTLLVFLRFFYMLKLWTINEYVERRFSVSLRVVNSLIFMLGRLVYLGVVLYATALLLENALGWNPVIAVLAVGIFSTIYTYMGGMEAVVWTDVVQFFVLLGGVLLVIGVISWYTPGGVLGIWETAVEHGRTFQLGVDSDFWDFSFKPRISLLALLLGLPFAVLTATDQVNLQRCLACKNFKEVARAVCWSTIGNLPVCFLFYFAGLAVFVFFKVLRPELDTGMKGDEAFCRYISVYLPTGIRGLLAAGVLAAVMSTVDSVQNSLSTVFVKDIYQRLLVPGRDETHYLSVAKLVTLLVGAGTCLFGVSVLLLFRNREIPLLEVSNLCLGVLGSFSSAIFMMGLLTSRVDSRAMIFGLIVALPGAVYFAVFRYLIAVPEERIGFMFLSLINIFTAMGASYLFSLFSSRTSAGQRSYVIWHFLRRGTAPEERNPEV